METIIASILAFASTNIDDVFILLLFFSNKEFKPRQIIIGQYVGIIALIIVSLVGSVAGLLVDSKYIGLLGVLPIAFGIRKLLQLSRLQNDQDTFSIEEKKSSNKTLLVAGVTIANGGDNIGIYVPLFVTLTMTQKIVVVIIFLLMVALWCVVAWYLSKNPAIAKTLKKYGHVIMPIVLILLGIYILYESGSMELFSSIGRG